MRVLPGSPPTRVGHSRGAEKRDLVRSGPHGRGVSAAFGLRLLAGPFGGPNASAFPQIGVQAGVHVAGAALRGTPYDDPVNGMLFQVVAL